MKREPVGALVYSVWDCFVDELAESWTERFNDALRVIVCWWKGQ